MEETPDEIRLNSGSHGDRARYLLARFAVKSSTMNTLAVFKEDGTVWTGWSAYQTFREVYFEGKRKSDLIYRRLERER